MTTSTLFFNIVHIFKIIKFSEAMNYFKVVFSIIFLSVFIKCTYAQLSPFDAENRIIENEKAGLTRYHGLACEYIVRYSSESVTEKKVLELKQQHLPDAYDIKISGDQLVFKIAGDKNFEEVRKFATMVIPQHTEFRKNGFYLLSDK
jgi:hypothetical protein